MSAKEHLLYKINLKQN